MSVASARTKLVSSLKDLHVQWEQVQRSWDDPVRKKFEAEFIDPLEGHTRHAVAAIEQMHEIIGRVRQECT